MRPRQVSRRWLLAMLVLLWPGVVRGAGVHRSVEVESLRITIDSEWAERMAPGYIPVRFDITNLGEARIIEIAGQSRQYFRPSGPGFPSPTRQAVLAVRQSLSLARGDRVRLTLSVPVSAESESIQFRVLENNRLIESFGFSSFQSAILPTLTAALLVAEPSGVLGPLAPAWARTFPPRGAAVAPGPAVPPVGSTYTVVVPGGAAPGAKIDFVLDPRRLPASWLGYTTLRAVLLGPAEWAALDDAQRRALLTWVACGGDMLFVDGAIDVLFGQGQAPPVDPGGMGAGYFFGRIHLLTANAITDAGLDGVIKTLLTVPSANVALPAHRALDWTKSFDRGFALPIPGIGRVPAGAYLFILVAFGILIGPVNFFVLWRRRQQALLVVTAPLISIVFVVLLVAYVIAGEGFRVYGRAATFTMLDQARKQASTRATVSLYAAGTAPSGGLAFPRDVAVYPRGTDGRGAGHDRMTLDLSDTQRFQSGLINARMPTNMETIAFRPARERLQFVRDGDRLAVVNGLGATVTRLIYRAGDTVLALRDPLLPGGKAALDAPADIGKFLVSLPPPALRFERIVEHQASPFYLAVLETSPFWEPGIAGVHERDSVHVVLGSLEAEP